MPVEKDEEVTVGVDIDKNGKPDFTAKIKGRKKVILLMVGIYVAGFLSHLGVSLIW